MGVFYAARSDIIFAFVRVRARVVRTVLSARRPVEGHDGVAGRRGLRLGLGNDFLSRVGRPRSFFALVP